MCIPINLRTFLKIATNKYSRGHAYWMNKFDNVHSVSVHNI